MLFTQTMEDILKKGFLDQQEISSLDLVQVLTILTVTLLIGVFIFFIYRLTFDGVVYNHRYNASVLLIALITALIIMTIQSNIILSLGMVGALSIVRFRTALKEPMDIVYMFWGIAVGITAGSGLFYIAVGGSVFIGLVMILLALVKTEKQTYLLILTHQARASEAVEQELRKLKTTVKSKIMTKDQIELTMQLKYKEADDTVIDALNLIVGVTGVSLVNFEENII